MSSINMESILSGIRTILSENNEALKAELVQMLQGKSVAAAEPTKKSSKKSKKASETGSDAAAEPKEKKPPSEWVLFTVRVEQLVRQQEEALETPASAKMKTTVAKQFASYLKTKKGYAEWTDEEIQLEIADFTPPEVSKQEAAGKNKKKSASNSVASAASIAAERKEEEKVDSDPVVAAAPVEPVAEAKPEAKPKKSIKPKAKKEVDLKFRAWTFEGTDYFKNERGDVITTDEYEWVGLFNGKKIDESAPEPADLAEAQFADE